MLRHLAASASRTKELHQDGAESSWIVTDELDRLERIARVLTARARWDLAGGAMGMVAFGVLGWAAGLATAIVVSGAAMARLGLFVAVSGEGASSSSPT